MLQRTGKYAICNHLAKQANLNIDFCPTITFFIRPEQKNGPAGEAGPFLAKRIDCRGGPDY